jgi:DNA-binding NarL/FixJ family response regulator
MTEAGDAIRVLVVDDHRVVREGIRSYFALLDDIEAAGEASDGRAALDALALTKRALVRIGPSHDLLRQCSTTRCRIRR